MDFKELRGKAVVAVNGGELVGRVEDLLVDIQTLKATDYAIKGNRGHGLLAVQSVRNVGPDAITIDQPETVRWGPDGVKHPTCREASDILKLTMVDSSGSVLGDIKAMDIDPVSGALTHIEAHQGGIFGIGGQTSDVPIGQVRGIGDKLVTVDRLEEPDSNHG